jgi:hypothetical protein
LGNNENQANAIAQSMFGVFGKKAEDVKVKDESAGSGSLFFNPDAKSAPNQVYRAIIKFMPKLYDLENPNKTETVETVSYWIPEGPQNGFRYTSPKSLGKMEKCIVADKYWALKGSEDVTLQKLAGRLSYKRQFFAVIQVIEDQAKPENNGKLFLYDVPFAIQKKMNAIMYPSKEDIKMGAIANNIFDPIDGCPLVMKVSIKNTEAGEFRDYDECNFNDRIAKTMIVDKDNPIQPEAPKTEEALQAYQTAAINMILSGPSLKDVEYKPATEEQLKRIQTALANLTNGNVGTEAPATTSQPEATAASQQEATTSSTTETTSEQPSNAAVTSAADLVSQVMGNKEA